MATIDYRRRIEAEAKRLYRELLADIAGDDWGREAKGARLVARIVGRLIERADELEMPDPAGAPPDPEGTAALLREAAGAISGLCEAMEEMLNIDWIFDVSASRIEEWHARIGRFRAALGRAKGGVS